MTIHKTGKREEWLEARLDLLKAEKELTRRRQELPWVRIDRSIDSRSTRRALRFADLFQCFCFMTRGLHRPRVDHAPRRDFAQSGLSVIRPEHRALPEHKHGLFIPQSNRGIYCKSFRM